MRASSPGGASSDSGGGDQSPSSEDCSSLASGSFIRSTSLDSAGSPSSRISPLFFDASVRPSARRRAVAAVLLFGATSLCGLALAPAFLSKTRASDFAAPADSPSKAAEARLLATFPQLAQTLPSQIVVVIRALQDQPTVLTEAVATWSQRLVTISTQDERVVPFRPLVAGYYAGALPLGLPAKDALLRSAFVSADNRTTVIVLLATNAPTWNGTYSPWAYKFWLMSFMREFCGSGPPGTEVLLTGNFVTYFDTLRAQRLEPLLMWAELRVVPMAILVLAFLVKEAGLLLLPPITLAAAFLTTASVMLPVAMLVPLSTDVPPSMVSVIIALSMDYSLFMLARFNENRAQHLSIQSNVEVVVRQTGHTVVLSGLLIAIAYSGALSLPEDNLRYAGLALGITTVVVVMVSVCLMPALLLIAGKLLTTPLQSLLHCDTQEQFLGDVGPAPEPELPSLPYFASRRRVLERGGGWNWLVRRVEQRPITAVAAIFALFSPVLVQLPRLRASADTYDVAPMGLASVAAFRALQEDFVVGRFDPYLVLVTLEKDFPGNSLLEPKGHQAFLELAGALWGLGGVGSMLGSVWLATEKVDWERSRDLPPKFRGLYRKLVNTHMLANGTAALLQVHTTFLPRGPAASEWVLSVRSVLDAWTTTHGEFAATLTGGACEPTDSRAAVMGSMPIYLGVILLVVMAIVYCMFGSVVLPFRLALAILFTLAATFGITVLVYQTPLLHGVWPWLADYNGLSYQVIPMASCVAIALGMDYDIFLVSRIFEYRLGGYPDAASIMQGVARTGGIISGAGLVMSLAFSGLFFSDKLVHQQIALTLVSSVLLDTFVVRTVLVPALMLIARRWNWWPRKVPECEDVSDDVVDFELTPGAVTGCHGGH